MALLSDKEKEKIRLREGLEPGKSSMEQSYDLWSGSVQALCLLKPPSGLDTPWEQCLAHRDLKI